MKSVHSDHTNNVKVPKEKKLPIRSRSLKSGFQVIKNHMFNLEAPPWGYNSLLGYCEQPQTFAG